MINEIKDRIGKKIQVEAKVVSLKSISGKTLLTLRDSSGSIQAVSKKQLDVLPGQSIRVDALVKEFKGEPELEILSQEKKADFLIKSENLAKFEDEFKKAAAEIRSAINNKRHIIIRHHDDTDGYAAGFVIEKAMLSIIDSDKPYQIYSRKASRTPFYDYIDALVDLNYYLSVKKYNENPPLIILADLGSNDQSIASIKRLKKYGIRFLIVDHHLYDEENKKQAAVFLNTHDKGLGSDISAGALAAELANFLKPGLDLKHIPAVAGTADKSAGSDYEKYLKLSGLSKDYLIKWSTVIDHETYFLRFPERLEFLEDLFSLNVQQVEEIYRQITKEFAEVKKAAEKYVEIKQAKDFKVLVIEKDKVSHRGYAGSKLTRITHDLESGPRITLSISGGSMISYRADDVDFSGVELLKELKDRFPHALVSGGGHAAAGAIKFTEASAEEVMDYVFKYLKL